MRFAYPTTLRLPTTGPLPVAASHPGVSPQAASIIPRVCHTPVSESNGGGASEVSRLLEALFLARILQAGSLVFIATTVTYMRAFPKTEPMAMFFAPRAERKPLRQTHAYIEGFNNLVKYLVRLRRDGTLSDDDFAELVKVASSIFIEAEISDRVESVLESKKLDDILLGYWK